MTVAPMFGHRYTVIPDSGVVELHCGTHIAPVRWEVGYHPSLDVLIEQARAHDVAEHDNDAGHAVAGPLEAEITRLRGALEALADLEPMMFVTEYEPTPVMNEIAARVDFAKRALAGGPAADIPVAGAAFVDDRDRDLEEIREYVASRAGGYVDVAMVRRNVRVGQGRATVLLGRLARAGEIIGPDDRGRYMVPR